MQKSFSIENRIVLNLHPVDLTQNITNLHFAFGKDGKQFSSYTIPFQFCVSCGVLVPDQQVVTPELLQQELAKRLAESVAAIPQTGKFPAKEAVTHRPPSSKDAPPTETDSGGDAS